MPNRFLFWKRAGSSGLWLGQYSQCGKGSAPRRCRCPPLSFGGGSGCRRRHRPARCGAFDDCLNAIQHRNLTGAVRDWIQAGRPFLGICVGYQALFDRSEEFNSCAAGLGIFSGPVVRFTATESEPNLKIPQIGWNQVAISRPGCPMFDGIPDQSYFYFVHSYFPRPLDSTLVAGSTTYGEPFAAAVCRQNVWATQFHPEKSQSVGLQLLRNFATFARR